MDASSWLIVLAVFLGLVVWGEKRRKAAGSHAARICKHPINPYTENKDAGRYTLHIVGEQYEGRQGVIADLERDQELRLRREPHNPHDKNAVSVETCGGDRVGYISRENAVWLSRIMDEGYSLQASVARLFDEGEGFVNVQIHIDGIPSRHDEALEKAG